MKRHFLLIVICSSLFACGDIDNYQYQCIDPNPEICDFEETFSHISANGWSRAYHYYKRDETSEDYNYEDFPILRFVRAPLVFVEFQYNTNISSMRDVKKGYFPLTVYSINDKEEILSEIENLKHISGCRPTIFAETERFVLLRDICIGFSGEGKNAEVRSACNELYCSILSICTFVYYRE